MQTFWMGFGFLVHGLFAVTVYYLFWYLRGVDLPTATTTPRALAIDALLAGQFIVWHSLLLMPRVRNALTRWIPSAAYGICYCAVTCTTLLAMIFAWQPCGDPLWNLHGGGQLAVRAAYYGSWGLLLYSLSLSGFGHQTGWTSWWPWVRGSAVPQRKFQPRGVYLLMRHPVYLSLLSLVWLVPCMTMDRVVLTAVWTSYVFVGSWLKDRRMAFYLGATYRQYQERVPGYPGIPFGPLGRLSPVQAAPESRSAA